MSSPRLTLATLPLRNRASAADGGWIHIVPKGELLNDKAGVVQVLDDGALDSILRNIESDRARLGARWPGLYAGREHHIYDDKDSEALAWFKNFQKRADGIWAHDDGLTDLGREALQNQRYKFTSFVADRRDTQPLGGNRHRILKVDTIGFTNQANGKELLSPITNRGTFTAAPAQAHRTLPDALPGVHPQAAANRLLILANRRKAATGLTFDHCWNRARLENPRLSTTANRQLTREEHIANRAPQFADKDSAQIWLAAEAVEKAVFDGLDLRQELHRSGSRYSLFVDK